MKPIISVIAIVVAVVSSSGGCSSIELVGSTICPYLHYEDSMEAFHQDGSCCHKQMEDSANHQGKWSLTI